MIADGTSRIALRFSQTHVSPTRRNPDDCSAVAGEADGGTGAGNYQLKARLEALERSVGGEVAANVSVGL
jgi:hypothetical protein